MSKHWLTCGVLCLTACSTPFQLPEIDLPSAWTAKVQGETAPVTSASLADQPWALVFPWPELEKLVDEALLANADLRIAAQRVELVRAQYGIEQANRWPGVNLGGNVTRQRAPGMSPTENPISENATLALSIPAWEIDLWGKLRDRSEARRRDVLSTEAQRDAARISLVAQVTTLYLDLLDLDKQLEISERTRGARERALRLNRLRFDEGIASVIDVHQAESSLAAADKARADQLRRRLQAENALAVLLGRNPGPISRTAKLDELALPGAALAGLPADLLQRRPDIRAAEEALRAADANLSAARKAFLPSLSLTTLVGYISPNVSQLINGDRYAWSVQPALNLPIFDAGRLRFNVRVAEAQQEILVEQYKASIRQAFRETRDALVAIEQYGHQQAAAERGATADEARLKAAQARYFSGVASYFEVLDAERQLLDSEISLSQIRRSLQQAYVQLYRALGGGWGRQFNQEKK